MKTHDLTGFEVIQILKKAEKKEDKKGIWKKLMKKLKLK
tara:strand:- start:1845 stop:1961 length:117 start_codon:yes stop_codon:yes gene_type:complete